MLILTISIYKMNKESLKEHVLKKVRFSDEELEVFLSYFKEKKVKKKQFIILPGSIAKYRSYVVKGAFRAYVIDDEGSEHTIQFAIEDWWISDYNSYILQQPATMFVVALEDGMVLQIDHESEEKLKAAGHRYETFFRIMAERSAAYHQRRVISNLTQNAEQRYASFMERYASIAYRVPQYALASYLGMTTQFLSKIRSKSLKS
jgi:CRP-like cAMP-binding protein